MPKATLLLDTNVLIDYLSVRLPFYEDARKLMICGRMGEFQLWMTSSQVTDVLYVLSQGGQKAKMKAALAAMQGLRTFVEVFPVGAHEVDVMLMTDWSDPEDALLFECALRIGADAVITRNAHDFESDTIKIADCPGLFAWLRESLGLDYAEVSF